MNRMGGQLRVERVIRGIRRDSLQEGSRKARVQYNPRMPKAKGTFEVKLAPLEAYNAESESKLGRMSLDKQFHGDLEGSSKGEMLHVGGETHGPSAAVAVERVNGVLSGKSGGFALYHVGVMENGAPKFWNVNIAPDTGTGDLAGIKGELKIIIEGKTHSYELDYELP